VVDVFQREVKLVLVVLGVAAVLSATVGEHAQQPDAMLVEERHDAIVEQVSRGQRCLAVIQLGEGDL
jgi:hypothetical protein